MALTLTLRRGEKFFVAKQEWTVERTHPQPVIRSPAGQVFTITDIRATEIVPEVFVSWGYETEEGARLVFRAPRKITILRGGLVERGT